MDNDFFTCVPFNMLPAEEGGIKAFDSAEVNKQKQWIRQNILKKTNRQIMQSPEAMDMIRRLGSDSNINAFAINWKYEDGTVNADLDEANYFMKRVTDRLSITSANTDPTHIPLYLTSTRFEPDDYGKCASKFMERLGIDACNQGLFVLRNVVMSPFPTQMDFLSKLMGKFEEVVREEVLVSRDRNTSVHNLRFLIQGPRTMTVESEAFLVFQTSFHSACRRQQLILAGKLNKPLIDFYNQIVEDEGSSGAAILTSVNKWNVQEELDRAVKETGKAIMKAKVSRAGYE